MRPIVVVGDVCSFAEHVPILLNVYDMESYGHNLSTILKNSSRTFSSVLALDAEPSLMTPQCYCLEFSY